MATGTEGGTPPSGTSTPNTTSNRRNNKKNNKGGNKKPSQTKFKGAVEKLATIGLKNDVYHTDNFLSFQRGIIQHVLSTFDNPGDIEYLPRELQNPMPRLMKDMPTLKKLKVDTGIDPSITDDELTADDQLLVEELKSLLVSERKGFVTRKATLQSNLPKLYGLIWGQCTPGVQQDIRNLPDYSDKSDKHDCLWLLNHLKQAAAGTDDTQQPILVFLRSFRLLITTRQNEQDTLQDFTDKIESRFQAFKLLGGDLCPSVLVSAEKSTDGSYLTAKEANARVEEKILAMITIEGAMDSRYSSLKRMLANQMVQGTDQYPESRSKAQTLLSKYVPDKPVKAKDSKQKPKDNNRPTEENGVDTNTPADTNPNDTDTGDVNVSFHQRAEPIDGPPVAGTNGEIIDGRTCFACGHPGHLASFCPNIGFQGVQHAFIQDINTDSGDIISINWILLDTGSTFSSFCNGAMLSSVTSCAPMTSYTNGGQLTYIKKGAINILPKVDGYFNRSAIANILSIKDVVKIYRVTMDTKDDNSILIHTPDTIWKFIGVGNGLYYIDITDLDNHKTNNDIIS
mmetsp:Transcript_18801/g.21383  ORF Transcript_18801/g.21383 Transcript_18801/m.21383 type:complete len:567 (+) Transcript_18801:256-1956(+)